MLLATYSDMPESHEDERSLLAALDELGIDSRWAVWDSPTEPFETADLVVLRSTWDYTSRMKEFVDWCESVPALANPARVVRWNSDKRYLAELAEAGVSVTPTRVVEPGDQVRADDAPELPEREFVVKPTVGAGSRGAARFLPEQRERALLHLRSLHDEGIPALVQPYQPVVDREGETALVFFGGVYSHGFVKGPLLDPADDAAGSAELGKGPFATDPAPELRRVAEDVLDATGQLLGVARYEFLYARVDLIRGDDGDPMLLELELIEPRLNFLLADRAAPLRFASAVRAELARRAS
ncbi:glutathione synthase/RimK-type ligase-like ATP-grasp enzyme [Actinopolyspora lacussalsi]|nr:glutathione synthase/RimK-type ligase-like ATP-grasp enzyme [Actinopolyspora lacussalsi]